MRILLTALLLSVPLIADDATPLATVEQLQSQLAAKDQQIAQLQAELQRASDQYLGCVVSRQNMQQRPVLNSAQQRMIERGPKPPGTPTKAAATATTTQ